MVLRQPDIHKQKNEVQCLPHTIYKSEFKMDQRPKYKS